MDEKITDIKAIKVYDALGRETIKVTVMGGNYFASYTVPFLFPTDNIALKVDEAINRIVSIIKKELVGEIIYNQRYIDKKLLELDNTPNFSHLGINSIFGISMAVSRLASYEKKQVYSRYLGGLNSNVSPIPIVGVLTGITPFQKGIKEYQIIPLKFNSFNEAIYAVSKVVYTIDSCLKEKGYHNYKNDEGNFITPFKSSCETLEFLIEGIERANYSIGSDFVFGLNIDADNIYNEEDDNYNLDNLKLNVNELLDYYDDLYTHYPILFLENYIQRNDLTSFNEFHNRVGHKMILSSDNIYEGSFSKVRNGYLNLLTNAISLKPYSFGTLSEYFDTLNYIKTLGIIPIFKCIDEDSEDNSDADLCLSGNYPFIEVSSFRRSDKNSKLNRLIELTQVLDNDKYAYDYLKDKDIVRNFLRNSKYFDD